LHQEGGRFARSSHNNPQMLQYVLLGAHEVHNDVMILIQARLAALLTKWTFDMLVQNAWQ